MKNTRGRTPWVMLAALLAMALASVGCGGDGDQSTCSGCRINGSFYATCPSNPAAYCAVNQPCSIAMNVCE